MKITFWGTRGSIPVPGKDTTVYGGNTTCLEITLDSGITVIIDAGTGLRCLGEGLAAKGERVDVYLLMTHIHWDHLLGFPFFPPIYEERTKISIDGAPNCMKGLRAPFDNKLGDGFFPVKFDDLKADTRHLDTLSHGPLNIGDCVIDSIPLQHPQGGYGFRFREQGKALVFITDNELTNENWAERHLDDYVSFCQDADILIHDAQYTPEERERRRGWGHSDYVSALELALKAQVKRLILFHHDPSRKDPEVEALRNHCEELARERGEKILIDAAREQGELIL